MKNLSDRKQKGKMDIATERSYATPFANSTFLPLLLWSLSSQRHTPKTQSRILNEYDYIVVGAGSAGSVVASRLSEIRCVNVLLLEAGTAPPLLTEVPAIAPFFTGSNIDWNYTTTPQRFTAAGFKRRKLAFPSGKALGGSSIWNGMVYARGNRKNYDDWAENGAVGWRYEKVLPYFKKLETETVWDPADSEYHGFEGPVTMERPRYTSEFREALLETAKQLGYPILDSNGREQKGFYDIQGTARNSQRCSTAKAYLVPAEDRRNLHIVDRTFVTKVLIENGQAVGVEFDHGGSKYRVRAKREVILSAGTVNSAKLLMLSGIGPKKDLCSLNIPVVADLPVGQNLQDHVGTFVIHLMSDRIRPLNEKLKDSNNIREYVVQRTGVLTSIASAYVAFLNNGRRYVQPNDLPDHELCFVEIGAGAAETQGVNGRPSFQEYLAFFQNRSTVSCVPLLLNPRSLGSVRLNSVDPYDTPLIDPNYYADPEDLVNMVEAMKHCSRILSQAPMLKLGSRPLDIPFPGCEEYEADEDQYLSCQARIISIAGSHQVGTVKMGHPNDPTSVVDPTLRVLGIKGLRVVDASVMPKIPSGNTGVPTIMIAEKTSDIIKSSILC